MKRLLIAAVVLAGLGGAIWWSEKQEEAKKDQPDPKAPPKILSLSEESLERVEIERPGEPAVVLTKDASGTWSIAAPVQLPADSQPVTAITASVTNLSSDRVIDENLTDLAAYGLEPPQLSLKLTMKDGAVHRLRIGEDTPDRSATYVSVDGDSRLFAMSAYHKTNFDKDAPQLREKHLLKFMTDQLSRVELNVSGKPGLEFSRAGQSQWQILRPRPLRADSLEVDELVRQLHEAEMDVAGMDPLSNDPAAVRGFASGRPLATARVTTPSGVQTLEVRQSGGEYFARSSEVPGAFRVLPILGTAVNKTLEDFLNKRVFDFGFDDPVKFSLKDGEEEKIFEKADAKWLRNGREMDSIGVQNVIDKLRELTASRVDDAAMPKPELELTVVSKNGERTERVAIALSGNDYLARRENESAIYRLESHLIAELRDAAKNVQEAAQDTKGDNK